MGIFGLGSKDTKDTRDTRETDADSTAALDPGSSDKPGAGGALANRLLAAGIDGKGRFDSAAEVAAGALRKHDKPEDAVDSIVRSHLRLAAAGGFVTSLGGFVTMSVALPANVVGFYVLSTRMVASIAAVRGYDLSKPEVRAAILLTLTGSDSDEVLKSAGMLSSGRLVNIATGHLPAPVLMAVNKGVGFRLLRQLGTRSFSWLGKGVPLAGGLIGAGADGWKLRGIANTARKELPAL